MEGWKVFLLLTCINIMLNFGVVATGGQPLGDQILTRFFNIDYSTGNVQVNSATQNSLPTNPNQGVNVFSNITFTDGLGTIWNFLIALVNIFTAPIGMLSIPGFYSVFALIFVVPLVALNLLAIVSMIRGFPF